jgi:hypothetical protein
MRPFPEEIRPLRISGTASIRLHQPEEGKADPLAGLSSPPPYHLLPADRARSAPLLRKRIRGASFTDFYLFSLLSHTYLHDLSLYLFHLFFHQFAISTMETEALAGLNCARLLMESL